MITGEGVLPSSLRRRGLPTLVIGSQRRRAQGPPPTAADTLGIRRLRTGGEARIWVQILCVVWGSQPLPEVQLWLGADFAISSEVQVAHGEDSVGMAMAQDVESVLVVIYSGFLTRVLRIISPQGRRLGNCGLRKEGVQRKHSGVLKGKECE